MVVRLFKGSHRNIRTDRAGSWYIFCLLIYLESVLPDLSCCLREDWNDLISFSTRERGFYTPTDFHVDKLLQFLSRKHGEFRRLFPVRKVRKMEIWQSFGECPETIFFLPCLLFPPCTTQQPPPPPPLSVCSWNNSPKQFVNLSLPCCLNVVFTFHSVCPELFLGPVKKVSSAALPLWVILGLVLRKVGSSWNNDIVLCLVSCSARWDSALSSSSVFPFFCALF